MSTHSSAPQGNQCEMSNCLASVGTCNQCLTWWQATILWRNDSCQNRVSTDQSHIIIFMGSSDNSSRSCVFSCWPAISFYLIAGSSVGFSVIWFSSKVNYWFVDFFAMVLRQNPLGNWVISISCGQKPCTRIIYTISHSFLKIFFQRL